jgi:AraC-like DNA-binding protein
MRSQLFDLDLSPRKVADHHRISIRYVHSLFGSTGTTFGTELRAIRLKRFREMLTDPAFTTKRISELALRCGYRDSAYLSQVFKEEFGKTPTEFRLLRAGMH